MDVHHPELVGERSSGTRFTLALKKIPMLLRIEADLAGVVPKDVKALGLSSLDKSRRTTGRGFLGLGDLMSLIERDVPIAKRIAHHVGVLQHLGGLHALL